MPEPGDMPPGGYCIEWADVQLAAGLEEFRCPMCGLWQFPQQLSFTVITSRCEDRNGNPVECRRALCHECAKREKCNDRINEHAEAAD